MGEISEALVRARKENEGSEHATRADPLPGSRDSHDPNGVEGAGSDLPPLSELRSSDTVSEADASRSSKVAAAGRARSIPHEAPSGELPRLSEMTESLEADSAAAAEPPAPGRYHEISRERDGEWVSRLCAVEPQGPAAVRFRHLAVRVRSMMDQKMNRSVLVTSALPGEGKTTVSVNLALALASIAPDHRVALVDMDLRRGRVGKALGFEGVLGLESYLAGEVELGQVRVTTDMPSLDFFPTAKPQSDAHRLLGGATQDLFAELNRQYDYVVIDGPPVLPVPDVPLLAPYVGGCLAVVASGRTRDRAFRDCLELLPRSSILGVFLNESRSAGKSSRYGYYAAAEGIRGEVGGANS